MFKLLLKTCATLMLSAVITLYFFALEFLISTADYIVGITIDITDKYIWTESWQKAQGFLTFLENLFSSRKEK